MYLLAIGTEPKQVSRVTNNTGRDQKAHLFSFFVIAILAGKNSQRVPFIFNGVLRQNGC